MAYALTATKGVYVSQAQPTTNFGSSADVFVGESMSTGQQFNGWFEFNLSSVAADIVQGYLEIDTISISSSGGTFVCESASKNYSTSPLNVSTITWNNQPDVIMEFGGAQEIGTFAAPTQTGVHRYLLTKLSAINLQRSKGWIVLRASSTALAFSVDRSKAKLILLTKTYGNPTINISNVDRQENKAVISFSATTGYGGTQSNDQIRKVEYSINNGAWTQATLGAWTGLNNSFEIGSLTAASTFGLRVRVTNKAPDGTGLDDKVSAINSLTVFEYLPGAFFGGWGIKAKRLLVHSEDFGVEVEPGCAVIEKELKVSGLRISPREYLTVTKTATQAINTTGRTGVILNSAEAIGTSLLELTGSTIKCKANCYLKLTAMVTVTEVSPGSYLILEIRRNGTVRWTSTVSVHNSYNQGSAVLNTPPIEAAVNDTFDITLQCGDSSYVVAAFVANTFMSGEAWAR